MICCRTFLSLFFLTSSSSLHVSRFKFGISTSVFVILLSLSFLLVCFLFRLFLFINCNWYSLPSTLHFVKYLMSWHNLVNLGKIETFNSDYYYVTQNCIKNWSVSHQTTINRRKKKYFSISSELFFETSTLFLFLSFYFDTQATFEYNYNWIKYSYKQTRIKKNLAKQWITNILVCLYSTVKL